MNIYSVEEGIFDLSFNNSRVILVRIRMNAVYILKNLALFA